MTRIIILAAPNNLSEQLARLQPLGLVPSGKPIKWDGRDDQHDDYLEPKS